VSVKRDFSTDTPVVVNCPASSKTGVHAREPDFADLEFPTAENNGNDNISGMVTLSKLE
jgi:hypothetical protein